MPFRESTRVGSRVCACASLALAAIAGAESSAALPSPAVNVSTVATDGYATDGINSVAINRNNLVTVGEFQFVAFYDAPQGTSDPASVKLGRRRLGTSDWRVVDTGYRPYSITDDHDTVAIAVDGKGYMHMSWGMHNHPMNYVISNQPVTGPAVDLSGSAFTRAPFWTGTAANFDSAVTYPEFYRIPGSGDLLFTYRQGGTGGGSGNGDQYFVRYDVEAGQFNRNLAINGQATSVNAYLNSLVYDSTGTLQMSWTWCSTPQFQTNHNIMYARSQDDGVSWCRQDGRPFTLPITEGQGGVIAWIPEQSTLINQTSMTVDKLDRPLVATWYAPGAAAGNHTRQYMLHYFDGRGWRASQITDRPNEAKQSDSTVRELGRPIVLVNDDNRVLVVMRYKEAGNSLVVAVTEDRQNWEFLTLSAANMGRYEPTYDPVLWERENKLHLFYQQVGIGQSISPVSVLEWDAKAYFASIPEPRGALALLLAASYVCSRPRGRSTGCHS